MNKIFLRQSVSLNEDEAVGSKGQIKGVAYTGAVIPEHGPFKNLVIDLSTLTIHKEKTPLFRDHNPSQVAGFGKMTIVENQLMIDGQLSRKSAYGKEIIDLSEDGFEWELSMGLHGGTIEEFEDQEFNGKKIAYGHVVKNAVLRETSIVSLGADANTASQIFSLKEKSEMIKLTEEQWAKFACGCGGSKESKPEDLEKKFAADQEKIDALEKEVAAKKEELEALQKQLDEIKSKEEEGDRKAEIESALDAKGIKLSAEKISEACKTKDATTMLLSFISEMKEEKKPAKAIDKKFAAKVEIDGDEPVTADDPAKIRLAANKMVEDGKATNFMEAIEMLQLAGE